jgi:hypothetical protein
VRGGEHCIFVDQGAATHDLKFSVSLMAVCTVFLLIGVPSHMT